jgi:hypothetical protein
LLKVRWDFVDRKEHAIQLLAPHILEAFSGVQHHVVKTFCARPEAGEAWEHEFSAQSPPVAVSPAPPETTHIRAGVFLCLIAIGVSPPDCEARNMWL